VVQDVQDRFWVRYKADGSVAQLYRLTYSDFSFERWNKIDWIDASDRYERITQDAACDEVSLERANQIIDTFAEVQATATVTDGFSALATSAIALHEVFLGFVSAGFTEDQALKIITGLIRSE
jgi:hypothetical protein